MRNQFTNPEALAHVKAFVILGDAAVMRRSIFLWSLFVKNLVPLRGEAFHN